MWLTMVTTIKIIIPIHTGRVTFGYKLENIKENRSTTGKCLKILCTWQLQENILRPSRSRVLAPRFFFFSSLLPPSMSRFVSSLPLQETSGCPGLLLIIFLFFFSEIEVGPVRTQGSLQKVITMRCDNTIKLAKQIRLDLKAIIYSTIVQRSLIYTAFSSGSVFVGCVLL